MSFLILHLDVLIEVNTTTSILAYRFNPRTEPFDRQFVRNSTVYNQIRFRWQSALDVSILFASKHVDAAVEYGADMIDIPYSKINFFLNHFAVKSDRWS